MKAKLAIVEDSSELLALYKAYLEADFECFYYQSANAALAALQDGLVLDFVMLDIHLLEPEENGVHLALKIREMGLQVPLLFTTSASDTWISDNLLRTIKDLEPCDCLHKPFSIDELSTLIKSKL